MEPRQRLRSSSSPAFVVPATRKSSLGDRTFLVGVVAANNPRQTAVFHAAKAWNSLPSTVTAASTLHSFR